MHSLIPKWAEPNIAKGESVSFIYTDVSAGWPYVSPTGAAMVGVQTDVLCSSCGQRRVNCISVLERVN